MPYSLVEFPDGYRVQTDGTGEFHSTDAMPLARAKRQLTALNISLKGGAVQRNPKFYKQLRDADIDPMAYLKKARAFAKRMNYDPKDLDFADNDVNKLQIKAPDGSIRRFGRVGYGDFLIWSHKEARGEVPKGYADQKRRVFRKSHIAMSKKRGITDEYAPNNLAINILWFE